MDIRELQCEFETSQKSFYGKAKLLKTLEKANYRIGVETNESN